MKMKNISNIRKSLPFDTNKNSMTVSQLNKICDFQFKQSKEYAEAAEDFRRVRSSEPI